MRIFRRQKGYEVMDGHTSCGVFPSLETASDYVVANGGFQKHVRDCKNTAKYDIHYDNYIHSMASVDKTVWDLAYENFITDLDD